jgi:hypothetical protein
VEWQERELLLIVAAIERECTAAELHQLGH